MIFFFKNNCLVQSRRLFFFLLSLVMLGPVKLFAHRAPNTMVLMDIDPNYVSLEVQMPIPELELAFGHDLSKDPEHVVDNWGPQIKAYLLQHIHAYAVKDHPWQVAVTAMRMDNGLYADVNIPYWEVNAKVVLTPQPGDNTRDFYLVYDVIMHQVINHVALVSVRTDWASGTMEQDNTMGASAIGWNLKDNIIPPLHVSLEKGSWWKGFSSIVHLGMRHIAEGTDHLLFILALLLAAPLVANGNKWGGFGGVKYSIYRLLKIVTAFTIGHSLTLFAGAIGWLRLPSQPIEVLIAVSILVSAIHALRPLFPGREMYIAAGFGLIHGLAFAGTLTALKLSGWYMVLAIFGFNIGIELMQLFVILITVPWLIILSRIKGYRILRITGALFTIIVSLAWIIERSFNQPNLISDFVIKAYPYAPWLVAALAVAAVASLFIKGGSAQNKAGAMASNE
ncbi:HupE/UreJ family protein [Parafilimonas sp.]|uniref:HupE/UreJ family protein n=1 Tax=Parafilimonas sp. TaxID=1969739 RepID=UPI0039E4AAA4